ncbi:GGDEF domain-containing protein [Marinobacter salarius]|uniref:diguanylate cyclase n=1 Tax=Marinobacter salarius TaxID=1420917 RepID=A0A1W6KBX3_9GAMM|nr:GGDEF domain-containing protein [Marinobacter salarius]ARM84897.1 putative diguanylate cyclase YdaM [Marinobacter salarius]
MSQPDNTGANRSPAQNTEREQKLRIRRLGMSFGSYMVTFSIVVYCWVQGLISLGVTVGFLAFASLINATFWWLIHTGRNLKFHDPSMTSAQMIVSLLPPIWVMAFLEAGQARAIFLLIAVVPMLFGILALTTRQFIVVGVWFFALYGLLHLGLWAYRPEVLNSELEILQTVAFALVMAEITVIGGFISSLRGKLRQRNLELGEAMEQIRELVNVDALTGVYNRRRLFEVISEESNRYSRMPGSFSICLMDIDHFKEVNDTYGHQAGDMILQAVARSVKDGLRTIDCFGRYGGEEFLLVLPQTPLEGARIKAERVRETIERLTFPDIGDDFRVTVSIGVAEYHREESTDDTLLRADQALYAAKHDGRNNVKLAATRIPQKSPLSAPSVRPI